MKYIVAPNQPNSATEEPFTSLPVSFIDLSSESIKQRCLAVKHQVTKSKRYYTNPKHLTLHTKHYDASQDFVCGLCEAANDTQSANTCEVCLIAARTGVALPVRRGIVEQQQVRQIQVRHFQVLHFQRPLNG